jgi:transcriptional antiterminator RfaH
MMPCLPAEIAQFPENLFDIWDTDESERRWWAVYTKARQEKALSRQLLKSEIPFYLPLVANEYQTGRRRAKSYAPLFTGYVFLFGNDEERVAALTTNRISRILRVQDQGMLAYELQQLSRVISADVPLKIEQQLAAGDRVRVTSGPMEGAQGVVISSRGRRRLLVAVTFLQRGASLEIDDAQLEQLP